jgi:hypothetical protein
MIALMGQYLSDRRQLFGAKRSLLLIQDVDLGRVDLAVARCFTARAKPLVNPAR